LELGVKDSTGSTIFVLFDDVAEQVAQMKLVDLTATLENVNVKPNFNLRYIRCEIGFSDENINFIHAFSLK
jgi:hypothetical protein